MRPLSILLLVLLAGIGLDAQRVQVVDLGGGIYQAIGAGLQGGSGVRVPQSITFLIATSGGNVIVDTSIAAAARVHKDALSAVKGGTAATSWVRSRRTRPRRPWPVRFSSTRTSPRRTRTTRRSISNARSARASARASASFTRAKTI